MGFLNRDEWVGARYQMREKLMDIGDDFWIENDQEERVFKIDGRALSMRDTFVIENASGRELYKVQERKLSFRDKVKIERGDDTVATVKKALVSPFGDKYNIDLAEGGELEAKGDILEHEFEIERDGDMVAKISKKRFKIRDSYGIEVGKNQDDALLIAVAVCVEQLTRGGEDRRD